MQCEQHPFVLAGKDELSILNCLDFCKARVRTPNRSAHQIFVQLQPDEASSAKNAAEIISLGFDEGFARLATRNPLTLSLSVARVECSPTGETMIELPPKSLTASALAGHGSLQLRRLRKVDAMRMMGMQPLGLGPCVHKDVASRRQLFRCGALQRHHQQTTLNLPALRNPIRCGDGPRARKRVQSKARAQGYVVWCGGVAVRTSPQRRASTLEF